MWRSAASYFIGAIGVVESLLVRFWGLVSFLGIAACIAFVKIQLRGKVDFDLSWIKNDKTYYRKTFSSTGTHSFGSGSSGTGGSW
ncbi:hypothetical protein [Zobellia uliginosa]|uniref:hypothetical protein n=1 Tax=Zobellia uliginosa TaxID=143224 RepID=UPI0009703ACA|nr:hypothetical protein [Zobellia uliginosa]